MTPVLTFPAGQSHPIDTRVPFTATGFRPGARVRLGATVIGEDSVPWSSEAEFRADKHGIVDPSKDIPVVGSYAGIDGMGLFWSMRPQPAFPRKPIRFRLRDVNPLRLSLTAESATHQRVTAEIIRYALPPAVGCQRLTHAHDGLVGMFFRPEGPGPHPVVVVLGGSSGGISAAHAALLAGHGFVTLALAYFGVDPLPRELLQVPLEFWKSAVSWLGCRTDCDTDRLAIVGSSKGAELALLLASRYPEDIRAVVGYAPSSVVYQGIPTFTSHRPRQSITPMSSWTLDGSPVPFIGFIGPQQPGAGVLIGPSEANPISLREMHENPLSSIDGNHSAVIPVEQIDGPMLLISGTKDEVWPSTRLAEMVIDRLARHGRSRQARHLVYEGAGHLIGIPYLPSYCIGSPEAGSFGGTSQANAVACADSWSKALAFLHEHLGQRPVSQQHVE